MIQRRVLWPVLDLTLRLHSAHQFCEPETVKLLVVRTIQWNAFRRCFVGCYLRIGRFVFGLDAGVCAALLGLCSCPRPDDVWTMRTRSFAALAVYLVLFGLPYISCICDFSPLCVLRGSSAIRVPFLAHTQVHGKSGKHNPISLSCAGARHCR